MDVICCFFLAITCLPAVAARWPGVTSNQLSHLSFLALQHARILGWMQLHRLATLLHMAKHRLLLEPPSHAPPWFFSRHQATQRRQFSRM